MNESRLTDVVKRVLKLADADTFVSAGGGPWATTRMADNVITQNVASDGMGLSVECAYGKRHGSAFTNDLSDEGLRAAVRRAQETARVSPPDPEWMPLVPAREARNYLPVKAWCARSLAPDPRDRARALASAARKAKARRLRLSGAFSAGGGLQAIGNSAGLRATHRWTMAETHLTVLGPTGSGWAQSLSSDLADIDVATVAERATEIAARAQRPRDLPPGKHDVIMSPAAVSELVPFFFYAGLDAKSADEGHNFLRGKLGRKVCGENVTIRSDPSDSRCPGNPYQYDGLANRRINWFHRGTVENLHYSRFWAKKKRRAPTGYPANVIMDGGDSSVPAMIASTGRGLLITRFWYIRFVDPMVPSATGMTRDGLFLIEDGKVTGPIRQLRFNENLLDVFNRIEKLGAPERAGEAWHTLVPPLKIKSFNFTSGTRF